MGAISLTSTLILFTLLLWAGVCAIVDARFRKISNLLTYPAALLALFHLAITGHTLSNANAIEAIVSALLVLLFTLPGYYRNLFGAGDIKMLLVLAFSTGLLPLLIIFATAGLALLLWRTSAPILWPHLPVKVKDQAKYLDYRSPKIAYAPFLFIGLLVALAI